MRHFFTVAIAVMVASAGAHAQNLDGFYGSKWGMTEQALQALYRSSAVPYTTKGVDGTETYQHFGFPRGDYPLDDRMR